MKIIFDDLTNYHPYWGTDKWDILIEKGKLDAFNDYMDEHYPDGLTEGEFNDLLGNCDDVVQEIFSEIGIEYE